LVDTSTYANNIPVSCPTLRITSPGFNVPVTIDVLPSFNLVLTTCTLGLQTIGCGDNLNALPDGIYVINYSVSPNDKVYVEYNYLRVTQLLNKYYNILGQLELAACEPQADIKAVLTELRLIKSFIDAAQAKVEYTLTPISGMDIYIYAKKRLDKLSLNPYCSHC
jgi:hypothetical protein